MSTGQFRAKRVIDVFAAVAVLIFIGPLLGVIALSIRLTMGRPLFFMQIRSGYLQKPFAIYKFRTMNGTVDSRGVPLPDGKRLYPLGDFLRRTSLDELPQFWNVLRGEMSLVGPRPLLPEYLTRYNAHQMRRHEVKPGITGWPQVNGRNALTWEEKFDLDVWYVDHRSLWLDGKILWLTLFKVLRREGTSHRGHVTMPEFLGTADVTQQHE